MGTSALGGAGAFDVTIIAGLVAVMTAELVGETREKIQGGHKSDTHKEKAMLPMYEFGDELSDIEQQDKATVVSIVEKRRAASKLKEKKREGEENE